VQRAVRLDHPAEAAHENIHGLAFHVAELFARRRVIPVMGEFHSELKPVKRRDRWRILMSWPDRMPRLFGEFKTKAEAARWIKEHSWPAPDKEGSVEALPDKRES
jgi:hypothetical protein